MLQSTTLLNPIGTVTLVNNFTPAPTGPEHYPTDIWDTLEEENFTTAVPNSPWEEPQEINLYLDYLRRWMGDWAWDNSGTWEGWD